MTKYLITGFSGFVSKHFLKYLTKRKMAASVLGIDLHPPDFKTSDFPGLTWKYEKIDLMEKKKVENSIRRFQPDYILHLASYSSVAFSWKKPTLSFQNNTNIFLNLLETVRKLNLRSRILAIGSSDEYGNVTPDDLPLKEESPLNPVSPYAVARVSQELLAKIYVEGFGLDIIRTRSFNHIGPGQREIFVVSSFARQMVEMEKRGQSSGRITVGDTSIIRDFVDVRDVVRAYDLLFQKGRTGEVYNICCGKNYSLQEIIKTMSGIMKMKIAAKVDPELIRPSDNRIIIGSNKKIMKETGWQPEISLQQSLRDIIQYWRK